MKKIIFIVILTLISCSKTPIKHNKICCITFTNQKFENEDQNLKTALVFDSKNNKLIFSLCNLYPKDIYFTPPKIIFMSMDYNNENFDKSIVVKPYINQIIADKILISITNDSKKKNIIEIDSSMQRNDLPIIIKLKSKEIYTKEFELNCKKSDSGSYKISFLNRTIDYDRKVIKIGYPQNAIINIRK